MVDASTDSLILLHWNQDKAAALAKDLVDQGWKVALISSS